MASMQQLVLPVMESISASGPATRMQIFKDCRHTSWEQFKRIISMLKVQGMIKQETTTWPATGPLIDLTDEGRKTVKMYK